MATAHNLKAQQRKNSGTGSARALRREHMVPAIVYGGNQEPLKISLDHKDLLREIHTPGFFSRVLVLNLDGSDQKVLAKDLQLHPVSDEPLHVDFQRIDQNSRLHVHVPLRFINEDKSQALKRGATLNVVIHSLEIICSPHDIPESFTIDLSSLEMGGSITLDHVSLPKDVKPAHPTRDHVIATLVGGAKDSASAAE